MPVTERRTPEHAPDQLPPMENWFGSIGPRSWNAISTGSRKLVVEPLIEINRMIMQGLSGGAQAAASSTWPAAILAFLGRVNPGAQATLARVPGVCDVHDLHVWTITSGFPALSAHVVVGRDDRLVARTREVPVPADGQAVEISVGRRTGRAGFLR